MPIGEVNLVPQNIGLVSGSEVGAVVNSWRAYRFRGH